MKSYREVGSRLGSYILSSSPSAQQIHAFLGDLLPGDELLPLIRETIARPEFKRIHETSTVRNAQVQKTAFLNDLSRLYLPSAIKDLNDFLEGVLNIPLHDQINKTSRDVNATDTVRQVCEDSGQAIKSEEVKENSRDFQGRLDQIHDLWITPEAARSGQKRVIMIDDKKYDVFIPKNSKYGRLVRLKGLGKTDDLTQERGDLYLRINISLFASP